MDDSLACQRERELRYLAGQTDGERGEECPALPRRLAGDSVPLRPVRVP